MDSLFFKEYSIKISIFFSTGSTGPQSFCSAIVHKSRFEYGALYLVFSHISHPNLESSTIFLMDSLFFKDHFVKISKFLLIGSTSWHVVQPIHRVSLYGALILVILKPNSYMAWVHGLHFGPYFGFLAAHHESIWIIGGEAS